MSKLRARPCSCKRTRRVAHLPAPTADGSPHRVERIAAPPTAGRSIFICTADDFNADCLIYGVEVVASPSFAGSDNAPPEMEIRSSAEPVLRWNEKLSALAAVSGGTILGLVDDGSRRTVIRDVAAGTDAPGPRLHRSKRRPVMLPVGDDGSTVLVMDTKLRRPGRCCFEALRRLPGGGWRADALPDPPVEFLDEDYISCYFAIGSRAWITVGDKGTLSLDTETGTWRIEGTWEVPLENRGLFVPELGVVIGIPESLFVEHADHESRCCQVCAIDVEVRPPAMRHVWNIPPERVEDVPRSETVSLAYLGNGRLCISRSVIVDDVLKGRGSSRERGTSFTLVDVSRLADGDLQLAKHGKPHCHVWPTGHTGNIRFIQPA